MVHTTAEGRAFIVANDLDAIAHRLRTASSILTQKGGLPVDENLHHRAAFALSTLRGLTDDLKAVRAALARLKADD